MNDDNANTDYDQYDPEQQISTGSEVKFYIVLSEYYCTSFLVLTGINLVCTKQFNVGQY